jgi:FAD binding domain
MNTGLQDAFNLGWKLALVCRGEAGAGLLDTYEAERRPVAERIVSSGAAVETAHAMTDAGERAARDAEIRRRSADPAIAHHEAAATSELDRSYPGSRAVAGDDGAGLAPGLLLPDTRPVEPADGEPRPLHELTHRRGHTLLVLGGPQADPGRGRRAGHRARRALGRGCRCGRRPQHASEPPAGWEDRRIGGRSARSRRRHGARRASGPLHRLA